MPLESADRRCLLELARRSISIGCGQDSTPALPRETWSGALTDTRATFVTLKHDGRLRGCRGTVEPKSPLVEDVWQNAWASAYTDPRFQPVSPPEINLLEICISVLTPLQPLSVASEAQLLELLRPGLDGLVLRCGSAGATFLPAVWEMLPDPREFITQLKLKAGWSPSFWSDSLTAQRYGTETFDSAAPPVPPDPR